MRCPARSRTDWSPRLGRRPTDGKPDQDLDAARPHRSLHLPLHEIVGAFGPTLKALIQVKFGGGIMAATDLAVTVTCVTNLKSDRVSVDMPGKYLGYNARWRMPEPIPAHG